MAPAAIKRYPHVAPPAAAPAAAERAEAEDGCELEAAEVEARRTQQLADWGALLVQAAALTAAERVLLGPAARPVSGGPGQPGWRGRVAACRSQLGCLEPRSLRHPCCRLLAHLFDMVPAAMCMVSISGNSGRTSLALLCEATPDPAPPLPRPALPRLQDSQPLSSAELPISNGQRPPADTGKRASAVRSQAAHAVEALEQQRQVKLALAQAGGVAEADRRLLQAEAAADLQAQSLLAHWGVQVAAEARERMQQDELSASISS